MKILGPNETGKGILIEYDSGHISPKDNQRIISEMKDSDFSQDIILYAVLQKYDTPNKNGRIYPELLLKRENEKYQTLIKKGGALNELNHPSCHTGDVDILTSEGWKNIKNIGESENLYTLNKDGFIELKKIYSTVKHKYKGSMISLKGRNINTLVTPNHRFPVINKNNGEFSFIDSQKIHETFKTNNKLSNYYIPKKGIPINATSNDFILKGSKDSDFHIKSSEYDKILYKQDLHIPMGLFMCFMGIWLSEGHVGLSKIKKRKSVLSNGDVSYYESSDNGYIVGISQKKEESIFLIEELLGLLPFKVKKYVRKNGTTSFIINDRRLWSYLRPLGKSNEKYIPEELKNQPSEYLENLIKWFKLGDGRTIGKYHQSDVFSTSEKLILDLQEILIKTGQSGNIRKELRKKDRHIKTDDGGLRLIKSENSNEMWFLNFSKPNGIYLDNRSLKTSEVDFDGFVYSVDVPNHTYYVKSNGKCHWTGNSSLIDLDRVSHSILETWWDGKMLMGKIKLFTSPGWKKMGIVSTKGDQAAMLIMNGATLGISSRGVGSLKNIKGQNIVQEDFELVCFDLVSSPSTPGAYIFSDLKDRDQYQESIQEKSHDIDKMKNLMSKLNSFLDK
jgi:hypothetical protein